MYILTAPFICYIILIIAYQQQKSIVYNDFCIVEQLLIYIYIYCTKILIFILNTVIMIYKNYFTREDYVRQSFQFFMRIKSISLM